LLHRRKRHPAGLPLSRAPARHLPRGLPRWIGFHRAAAREDLPQHRVVYPSAGEEPRPNITALRGIRAQRPRPHMGGRALRPPAHTTLTLSRLPRPSGGCRFGAIPITHLHATTVETATDNPDLSPRSAALRTSGIRNQVTLAGVLRGDAHLLRTHRAHLLRRVGCRPGRVRWRSRPRAPSDRRLPVLAISTLVQQYKAARPAPCTANAAAALSARACADIFGPRPTSPTPVAAHPCRSSSNTSMAKHL
jgi:hypothetical protein